MAITLESTAFENDKVIPKKYGYKNGNNSIPLNISNVPQDASSLVVIMDDPDAMGAVGKVWVHWVLWNIPATTTEIAENHIPDKAIQGMTDFGKIGYGGPAPPDKEHVYVFKLYALDCMLDLKQDSTKANVLKAMQDHIIEETVLKGRYAP